MSAALPNECRKTTIISELFSKKQKNCRRQTRKLTDCLDLIHRRENDFVLSTHTHRFIITFSHKDKRNNRKAHVELVFFEQFS